MRDEHDLRARIEALERALSDIREERAREVRGRWRVRIANVIGVLLAGALAMNGASRGVLAQEVGPMQIRGSLTILDPSGKSAIVLTSVPGRGGQISVFNAAGQGIAQMTAGPSGEAGRVMVFDGGNAKPRAILGVLGTSTSGVLRVQGDGDGYAQISVEGVGVRTDGGQNVVELGPDGGGSLRLRADAGTSTILLNSEAGDGLFRAFSTGGPAVVLGSSTGTGMLRLNGEAHGDRALMARGDGMITMTNHHGAQVVATGVDTSDQGFFIAANDQGGQSATVSVGGDGTGLVQVWKGSEAGVVMGVKGGTTGDVCANGATKGTCLTVLAAKSFMPF